MSVALELGELREWKEQPQGSLVCLLWADVTGTVKCQSILAIRLSSGLCSYKNEDADILAWRSLMLWVSALHTAASKTVIGGGMAWAIRQTTGGQWPVKMCCVR